MAVPGCPEAVELLNSVFGSGLILNDGHEIFARINAGDDLADIAAELGEKFGSKDAQAGLARALAGWPPHHLEVVTGMVGWAMGKLDTEDRVTIEWKGDANSPETVTKFELRDHTLVIEFAHPPGALAGAAGVAAAS